MTKTQQDQAGVTIVERRAEPRTKTILSVLLRAPDVHPMEACLLDISSRGARLRAPQPIPVGAEIRIEAEDLLLFGTVKRCCQTRGAHEVGIVLTMPLQILGDLRRLNDALHRSAGE